MPRYFTVNKPFNVLSQFTSADGKQTLRNYFGVPQNVYPVGRLDYDSEGLLILTDDTRLNSLLLNPMQKHTREYWVQVEGQITTEACSHLSNGVIISINGKAYKTQAAAAFPMVQPPTVWQRDPPIRFRKNIPDSWLRLVLTEGKNRQVRRMTASVGLPTLRLIRYAIEQVTLDDLQPGAIKEWTREAMYKMLF